MNTETYYETLDPEDWDEMRALSHRIVDDAITYLEKVGKRPVWLPCNRLIFRCCEIPDFSKNLKNIRHLILLPNKI